MKKTSLSRKITIGIIIAAIALMALILLNSCTKTNDSINQQGEGNFTFINNTEFVTGASNIRILDHPDLPIKINPHITIKDKLTYGDKGDSLIVGIMSGPINFSDKFIATVKKNNIIIYTDTSSSMGFVTTNKGQIKYFKYLNTDDIEIKLESFK